MMMRSKEAANVKKIVIIFKIIIIKGEQKTDYFKLFTRTTLDQ